jgi:hypothetical protein
MPFRRPTTTPTPDELFDQWLVELGEAELKIILYIIRRTMGFKKHADAISYSQFLHGITTRDGRVLDRGCGVRNRTNLARALAKLEERTLIRSWKRTAQDGDADVTVYALHFEGDDEVPPDDPRGSPLSVPPWSSSGTTPGSADVVPPRSRSSTTGGTGAAPPVVPHRYSQQTERQTTETTSWVHTQGHGETASVSDAETQPVLTSEHGAVLEALLAEGVAPPRAISLCSRYAPEAIRQQLSWLDHRRYDDRAACLIAAIEQGYGPPITSTDWRRASSPDPNVGRRAMASTTGAVNRYSSGRYGVCAACGCSPCDPSCPEQHIT